MAKNQKGLSGKIQREEEPFVKTFSHNVVEGFKQFSIVCKGLYKFSPVLILVTLGYYNFGLFWIYLIILIGALSNQIFKN